ncbi:MAG: DUF3347 domain-containing protein [Stygiobacter sp.]|jgi:hypothetical protein|uniref:DUF3347 domain-containing protein n=1 Tax=Stygiobacter electus TaxID=3032292 RepID=A0AAE3P0S1_9BACT|nr:DUF3347 domain-containing protein [Stygiobacter electus]MDF1612282.1 DUF3347 domain-containing protein [Stygiobacter electus]
MKTIIFIIFLSAIGYVQSAFSQDTSKQALQMVITDYLNLKNALTKDNGDTVLTAANSLSAEFINVPLEIFSTDQKKIWLQYYDVLTKKASSIGSTNDISKQREQFKDLSSNFYDMLKEMEVNTIDLFYQYCPMADAYWISEKSKIANPYYGKKMLTCGSTKETLKANK